MLTCRDVIELLLDYLETSVTPDLVAAIEKHLADCPACIAYLNTYKKTQELTGRVTRVPMPEDVKARLRQFLLSQLARGTT